MFGCAAFIAVCAIAIAVLQIGRAEASSSKTLVELRIRNNYSVGFTLDVDCGPGKWRRRYVGPRKDVVLLLDGRHCKATPTIGRE